MDLSSWPMLAVAVVFVGTGLAVVSLIGALGARHSPWRNDAEAQAAVYETAKLVGGIVGLFLIFVLTQSMNYFREAEVATAREAGNLLQLDHALAAAPPARGEAARRRLHDYVRSVIEQEWPAMRRGQRDSRHTEAALGLLQAAVGDIVANDAESAARHNLQKNFEDIEDDRTARTGASESRLPGALWQVIGTLSALLAATTFLMSPGTRPFRVHLIYLSALMLLASLLFMADGPYRGDFSVGPRPLQRALARMAGP